MQQVNYSQMLGMTLGQLRRISLEQQKEEILSSLLTFRGEVLIKLNDAVIPTEIKYAEFDKKNDRIIWYTDLRAKDDNQRLVIDVYISDEIARSWAMGMESALHSRQSENSNHAAIVTSLLIKTIH